jgi:putative phosphoesterase
MTRIGLLSDTHIPIDAKVLPSEIKEVFYNVDLVLHGGDIYEPSVLDDLECIAPVLAAEGDDDEYDVTSDGRVKRKHDLVIDGINISITHSEPGFGPWSVFAETKEKLEGASFKYDDITDIVLFGHSHRPKVQIRGTYLMVNPGSPTFPYYVHRPGTVALLNINSGEVEVRVVQLR